MIDIFLADYLNPTHARALVDLLDGYARDPAGGSTSLTPEVMRSLPGALAARPQAFSVLAFESAAPVGLINCFEGFSTFACRPLVNVHDVVVVASHRGQRITQRMLECVEAEAKMRGACKLTLEVLCGNQPAWRAYEREGFANYQLDPAFGNAVFLQKNL